MKRICWLVVFGMMMLNVAAADTIDLLKPVWLHALENMQERRDDEAPAAFVEPKVVSGEADLEMVRSTVHVNDQYDPEAYVYAELKNTGDRIIRINGATLTVLDASGKQLSKREYASAKPDVVMPGGSLFVTEWLYDFVSDLRRVDSIQITLEHSEYSRKQIKTLNKTRAYVEGDYLYAEVTNTTEKPLFEIGVVAVALDKDGKILDMLREETYSGVGVAPDSTIVFRKMLERHALDIPVAACEAAAYVYGERN